MPSINATPKSSEANSYLTLEEANAFFTARPHTSGWDEASEDDQKASLIYATYILEQVMSWRGWRRTFKQVLAWPRAGVVVDDFLYDEDTVPDIIKNGTAELALALLSRDRTEEPQLFGQGFEEAQVGPLRVKVSREEGRKALLPDHVVTLLRPVGSADAGAAGRTGRQVRLRRT